MRFLKASPSSISFFIRSPAKWVGFLLFMGAFFFLSNAKATLPFQEFKGDLGSSAYPKLRVIVEPENISLGGRFALYLKMEVGEGWHIYSLDAKGAEEESLATRITLHSNSFVPHGLWQEPHPLIVWDGALERVVKTHERIVEFRRWYSLVDSLTLGSHEIRGVIVFRACNNKICNLPKKISFKAQVNVIGEER